MDGDLGRLGAGEKTRRKTCAKFREMPGENHLARIKKTTPSNIMRATSPSPIRTAASLCRWLELLPDARTPSWLCGITYDSKYPHLDRFLRNSTHRLDRVFRPTAWSRSLTGNQLSSSATASINPFQYPRSGILRLGPPKGCARSAALSDNH
jgi:hypothetical protein